MLLRALCLGLRKVLKEGESVPEMFGDPVVKRASHWVLSTLRYSKHLREYGLGEVRLSLFSVQRFFRIDEYAGGTRRLWRRVYDRM